MSIRLANSVFVHIPRTGGMWLRHVVDRVGLPHRILSGDLEAHLPLSQLPEAWRALPSFGFIRHPLAWLRSRWSHARSLRTPEEYRFYGLHRRFDACVRPTFRDTVARIVETEPGLTSRTFATMLRGVTHVYRTEDLPTAAFEALARLEGLTWADWESMLAVPPINGTSGLDAYREEIESLPPDLERRFLQGEQEALARWRQARLRSALAWHLEGRV